MKNCLRQWHHLLKITGGDLSLSKYKISILQWKQRGLWGLLTPELIKEDDSTISISDENMNNEKLARLDPTQAERILGVRLPMSGSMEHKFKYKENLSRPKLVTPLFNLMMPKWCIKVDIKQ